jgi:HAD superfamily hydrolase (TIGR01509 family)
MQAIYARAIPYLPGAVDAVALAAAHYPTGLASGSERTLIDLVVADAALAGKFSAVVCTDTLSRGKPAPDVYLEAARLLGVRPERCICVEDSGNGILAGAAAGMQVIAVPDPALGCDRVADADLVLDSLAGLRPADLGFDGVASGGGSGA